MLDIKTVKLRSEEELIASWDDKDTIIVSVVCATFNHEPYIEDAITGFLMQETDFAFEVIIHDDASTDNTADIVRQYQKQYPNIIKPIFQTENQYSKGGFRPTPYAEKFAQGKYIARCEGDDYWIMHDKLQLQCDFLNNNAEYVVCGTNSVVVNKINSVIYEDRWLHKGYQALMTPTVMFRKVELTDAFAEAFTNIPNGDTAFFMFLETKGKLSLMNVISTAYRVSESGIWATKSIEGRLLMLMKTWEELFIWTKKVKNNKVRNAFVQLTTTYSKLLIINCLQMKIKSGLKFLCLLIRMIKEERVSRYSNIIVVLYIFLKTVRHYKKIYKVNY